MSNPVEPSGGAKPVVMGKDPHNYRKVGYSMILISISLVVIALLVWAIGSNYHFASDIMAGQEVDAFTPKSGYNLVIFDYTQPVGAKLKFLDHANTMDDAKKLQMQHAQENQDPHAQVLIFDNFRENTTNSIALAEVYAMTPSAGYNIITDNTVLPVGAKLSSLKHDDLLDNATRDEQFYQDQIKDPTVKIIALTQSYDDNLNKILGSSYNPDIKLKNPNKFVVLPPPVIEQQPMPEKAVATNATSVAIPVNATAVISVQTSNQTEIIQQNASSAKPSANVSSTVNAIKNITLSESISINATNP